MTTGDLTAVIGVNAKMGPSVTPSRVPVCAPMGTRDGVVKRPVSKVTMARDASYPASVSMVPPATTRQESASVHQGSQGFCECQHSIAIFSSLKQCMSYMSEVFHS